MPARGVDGAFELEVEPGEPADIQVSVPGRGTHTFRSVALDGDEVVLPAVAL